MRERDETRVEEVRKDKGTGTERRGAVAGEERWGGKFTEGNGDAA